MNPSNAMMSAAPQKLMQDVMPPYAHDTAQSASVAEPAQPLQQTSTVTAEETPQAYSSPVEPAVAPQPMFPVHAEASTAAMPTGPAVPAEPAAFAPQTDQTPAQMQPEVAPAQSLAPHKPKTNWLIIGVAIAVSAGLAVAAYMAFKGA